MPYPPFPTISYSYTAFQQEQQSSPFPGTNLDADLQKLATSDTTIINFVKSVIRSDGRLNNGIVTADSLASSLLLGVETPTDWATAAAYVTPDTVWFDSNVYRALKDHTSGVFATDLAAGKWELVLDFSAPLDEAEAAALAAAASATTATTQADIATAQAVLAGVSAVAADGSAGAAAASAVAADGSAVAADASADAAAVSAAEAAAALSTKQDASPNLTTLAGIVPGAAGQAILAATDGDSLDAAFPTTAAVHGASSAFVYASQENVQTDVAASQAVGFAAAVARAISEGKPLRIGNGRTRLDSTIALPDGLVIYGNDHERSVLDFSNGAGFGTAMMTATGTLGTAKALTGALNKGSRAVVATGHGAAIGNWVRIRSNVDANSAAAGEDRLGDRANVIYFTEFAKVTAVADANNLTIDRALRFNYPIGSTIEVVSSVRFRLEALGVDCGLLAVPALYATLARGDMAKDVEIKNIGAESVFRACFDGPSIHGRFLGNPNRVRDGVTNLQLLKPLDATVGFRVLPGSFIAHGGQPFDVTYSPASATWGAPTLDTRVAFCEIEDTDFSALVDHPGCSDTDFSFNTFRGVRGAAFIRSRNGKMVGNRGRGDGLGVGVWAGENGYWSGLLSEGNLMENFDIGFQYSGAIATTTRAALDTANTARQCRVGLAFANSTAALLDIGFKSRDFRGDRLTETGITLNGNGDGIDIEGFQITGPLTNAGVEITGDLVGATIRGEVIDIGAAIPALKVVSGAPNRNKIKIRRIGACGLNSGVTRAMVQLEEDVRYSSTTTLTHTGDTLETTLLANFDRLPNGAFDETGKLKARIRGTVTGVAGTKTIRLRVGSTLLSSSVALNAASNGAFDVEMEIVGAGAATQHAYSKYFMTAVAAAGLDGPTNRAINLAAGGNLNLTVQLAAAADSITINSVEMLGSWA